MSPVSKKTPAKQQYQPVSRWNHAVRVIVLLLVAYWVLLYAFDSARIFAYLLLVVLLYAACIDIYKVIRGKVRT